MWKKDHKKLEACGIFYMHFNTQKNNVGEGGLNEAIDEMHQQFHVNGEW